MDVFPVQRQKESDSRPLPEPQRVFICRSRLMGVKTEEAAEPSSLLSDQEEEEPCGRRKRPLPEERKRGGGAAVS